MLNRRHFSAGQQAKYEERRKRSGAAMESQRMLLILAWRRFWIRRAAGTAAATTVAAIIARLASLQPNAEATHNKRLGRLDHGGSASRTKALDLARKILAQQVQHAPHHGKRND
jgi:hypothetical protein